MGTNIAARLVVNNQRCRQLLRTSLWFLVFSRRQISLKTLYTIVSRGTDDTRYTLTVWAQKTRY